MYRKESAAPFPGILLSELVIVRAAPSDWEPAATVLMSKAVQKEAKEESLKASFPRH